MRRAKKRRIYSGLPAEVEIRAPVRSIPALRLATICGLFYRSPIVGGKIDFAKIVERARETRKRLPTKLMLVPRLEPPCNQLLLRRVG